LKTLSALASSFFSSAFDSFLASPAVGSRLRVASVRGVFHGIFVAGERELAIGEFVATACW
jgi:hypothetical protein